MNYTVRDITVNSVRNTPIPATEVVPFIKKPAPLVIYVHGFKAERTEGGRFLSVAEELACQGIYGIMMDQPGCGQSEEPFRLYNNENSLADIESCIDYMMEKYAIDENRLAMVGYSNGGRNTAIYIQKGKRKIGTVALWAAAIIDGDAFTNFLRDPKDGRDLLEEARQNGFARYYNEFDDTYIELSQAFYDGMYQYSTVEGMKNYKGNVLICHGSADITVDPQVAWDCFNSLTTEKDTELIIIEGANHGFGLWDQHMEQSRILTETTERFLIKNI